jgi:hypothetical protein
MLMQINGKGDLNDITQLPYQADFASWTGTLSSTLP